MALPHITATGRLGATPELRHTKAGHSVASLRIACTDRRRTPNGDWEDGDTTWLDVTIWKQQGEAAAQQLAKGDLVTVTGRLTQREHDGKTYYGITADTIAKGLQRPGHQEPSQRPQDAQQAIPADPWGTPSTPSPYDEPPF